MKTDFYTKTILTVIAGALIIIVFQNTEIFPNANANKTSTGFISIPVNPDGSIHVKFTETMKVDVAQVGGNYVSGSIPINVKEISGSSINSSYGLVSS